MTRSLSLLVLTALSSLALLPDRATAMCIPVCGGDCTLTSQGQMNFVAIDRAAGRIRLVPNIRITGEAQDFALVVPTPSLPQITPAAKEIWDEAVNLTAPLSNRRFDRQSSGYGCASVQSPVEIPGSNDGGGVIVHGRSTVGMFLATIVSSEDPDALVKYLRRNQFSIASPDSEAIAGLAERGWFFTAMKLDTENPALEIPPQWDNNVDPVTFEYAATTFEVPLGFLDINRAAQLPMVFFVVDDHRVNLPGFQTTYANSVTAGEYEAMLSRFTHVSPFLRPGRYLTRLDRTFRSGDLMEDSITLEVAGTDEEFRRNTSSWSGLSGDWILLGLVPWLSRRFIRRRGRG